MTSALPSSVQPFIDTILHLCQSPATPLTNLSSSVALRHKFLSLSPDDPNYLQAVPSASITAFLESLSTFTPVFDASSALYRLEPDEQLGLLISRKCILSTEERPHESVGVVLVLEEGEWKFSDVCQAEQAGWFEDYETARADLEQRLRKAQDTEDDYWGDGIPANQEEVSEEEEENDYGYAAAREENADVKALKVTLQGLLDLFLGSCRSEEEKAVKKLAFIEAVGDVVNSAG